LGSAGGVLYMFDMSHLNVITLFVTKSMHHELESQVGVVVAWEVLEMCVVNV